VLMFSGSTTRAIEAIVTVANPSIRKRTRHDSRWEWTKETP
jgi:hypothetical protein